MPWMTSGCHFLQVPMTIKTALLPSATDWEEITPEYLDILWDLGCADAWNTSKCIFTLTSLNSQEEAADTV